MTHTNKGQQAQGVDTDPVPVTFWDAEFDGLALGLVDDLSESIEGLVGLRIQRVSSQGLKTLLRQGVVR